MAILQKTDSFLGRYKRIVPALKITRPLFVGAFYLCLLFTALILIVSLILLFVRVSPEKMLLPPDMVAVKDATGLITSYKLELGNGVGVTCAAADITLGHIKLVIYAKLLLGAVALVCLAPIFRFISLAFKNVASGNVFDEQNAKYINYCGVLIMAGSFLYTAFENIFNYAQINKFVTNADVHFVFELNWFGIIMGLFVVVIGTIYGYTCSVAAEKIKEAEKEKAQSIVPAPEDDAEDEG